MSVREQVIAIARQELADATPPQDADLSQHLDSMQRLALVVAIEDHFQICFEPEDDASATTLDDVVTIVSKRLSAS